MRMRITLLFSLLAPASGMGGQPTPELVKVHFSGKSRATQVLGRLIPKLGALQVEVSKVQGRVIRVLCREGEQVAPGSPIVQLAGKQCPQKGGCTIAATRSGVVQEILKSRDSTLEEGDGIVSILDPTAISVRLDIPAKYVKYVSLGETLRVWISNRAYPAQIAEILPSTGPGETTRGVRLSPFALPQGSRLDTVVNAEIPIPLEGGGAQVPSTAVAFYGGRHFIIKSSNAKLEAVAVQVLSESRETLWIRPLTESALREDDAILVRNVIYYLPELVAEKVDG